MNVRALLFIGLMITLFFLGSSIYRGFDGWFQTLLNGQEYCFRDVTKTDVSVASQGASVSYTKTEGDELCFRTKDSSIVEKLNQQIQDRKLKTELARLEASDRFWNETFPDLFLVSSCVLLIIFIMLYLSTRDGGWL